MFHPLFSLPPLKEKKSLIKRPLTFKSVMAPHCFKCVCQVYTVAYEIIFHYLAPTHFLTLYSDHLSIRTLNSGQVALPEVLWNHYAFRTCSTLGNWQTKKSSIKIQVKYYLFNETLSEFLSFSSLEMHYLYILYIYSNCWVLLLLDCGSLETWNIYYLHKLFSQHLAHSNYSVNACQTDQ